jgi:protein TonB
LLTSAGRIFNQPAPPPSSPAPGPAAKTVRDPKLISTTRVVYPAAARQSNIQGSVRVSASIDADGKVVGAKALSGPLILRQAAEDSVRQWKYSPGSIDGKPASSEVTVSVEFRLN